MASHKPGLFFFLGISLLIRLLVLGFSTEIPRLRTYIEGGDTIGYLQLAKNLLREGTYKFDSEPPTAIRMPGYPFILAVTYIPWQTPFPTQILQILLDIFTVFLTYKIARSLSFSHCIPFIAAFFVAFSPLMIGMAVAIYPDTITITLVTLAILILLRLQHTTRDSILLAIILGMSIYLKQSMFLVTITLLFLLSIRQSATCKGSRIILPFLIVGLLMSPWILRNFFVMHAFIPLTTSNGLNLYCGNNPQSDGGAVYSGPYILPNMNEDESDHEFYKRAVMWILANPVNFLELLPRKAARFIWPFSLSMSGNIEVPLLIFVIILSFILMFYTFVTVGIFRLIKQKRLWEALVLIAPFVSLLFISLLTYGGARYGLPAFPALAVLASLGLEGLFTKINLFHNAFYSP